MRVLETGKRWDWERGLCLRRLRRYMGWVRSGSAERRLSRMVRERELGGGLVRRAVSRRRMASGRWFDEQRRGMRRFICVTSSWVRMVLLSDEDEE